MSYIWGLVLRKVFTFDLKNASFSKDYEWLFDNMGNVSVNGWQGGDPEGFVSSLTPFTARNHELQCTVLVGRITVWSCHWKPTSSPTSPVLASTRPMEWVCSSWIFQSQFLQGCILNKSSFIAGKQETQRICVHTKCLELLDYLAVLNKGIAQLYNSMVKSTPSAVGRWSIEAIKFISRVVTNILRPIWEE